MSDPLGDIGIAEGNETPLRKILAPTEGDDYIASYYDILRTLEQGTVYIEETQDALPDNGSVDWPLVGIAQTEVDHFEGDSVHIYDGTEWVDTFQPVNEFVDGLDGRISDNEDEISDLVRDLYSASFIPTITDYPSDIELGESVVVDANIFNTGRDTGTQTVELKIDGDVVATEKVEELPVDETEPVTFTWDDGPSGDLIGSVLLTVETDDQDDSRIVDVLEPAAYLIDSVDIDPADEIENDDPATITADLENTGEVDGTQQVSIQIDNEQKKEPLSVDAGRTESFELEWDGTTAPGTYGVTVETDDDEDTDQRIRVLEPAEFTVTDLDAPDNVNPDETVEISATVENNGESEGDVATELEIDWTSTEDTEDLTLGAGDDDEVTLEWETPATGGGHDVAITLEADAPATTIDAQDSVSQEITVREPAEFDVSIGSVTDNPEPGDQVDVDVTVDNTGDIEAEQDIILTVDGSEEDSEKVTLDDGSTTETLTWNTSSGDSGSYDLTVSSDDDSDSATVDVLEPANFDVSIDTVTDEPEPGDRVDVDITVNNTGDVETSQDITLDVDGSEEDSEEVTVDDGSTTETLTWNTSSGDSGSYDLTVNSDDDSDSTTVDVLEPANFDVTIDSAPDEEVTGNTIYVDFTVENTGGIRDEQKVELIRPMGPNSRAIIDHTYVDLNGGKDTSETLEWTHTTEGIRSHELKIASDDDSDSTTVDILEAADFEVTDISLSESEIAEGESLTLTATVKNNGGNGDNRVSADFHVGPDNLWPNQSPERGEFYYVEQMGSDTETISSGDSETLSYTWTAFDNIPDHEWDRDADGYEDWWGAVTINGESMPTWKSDLNDDAYDSFTVAEAEFDPEDVTVSIEMSSYNVWTGNDVDLIVTVENDNYAEGEVTVNTGAGPHNTGSGDDYEYVNWWMHETTITVPARDEETVTHTWTPYQNSDWDDDFSDWYATTHLDAINPPDGIGSISSGDLRSSMADSVSFTADG